MSRTMFRRGAVAAVGIALLAAAVAGTPAVAAAPDGAAAKAAPTGSVLDGQAVPAGFASWAELLKVQQRLNAGAERITTAAGQGADSGFAGLVADPTTRQLRVFWKGQAPASLISAARAAVPVSVLPAKYSVRELTAAATRMLAKAGGKITSVGPRPDGAGLLVGTQDGLADAASYADVPVTVETGVSATAGTRWNDSPPWWGGGAWRNANTGGGCSTGFAVWHGGVARMLSAGHCGVANQVATDPTGQTIGTILQKNVGTDTLIINGASSGRVFNNSTNAAGNVVSEFSNPVIGSVASQVGNFVCSSGAYSGTRCSIRVVARNLCINVTGVGLVCNQVRAEQIAHTNAAGNGDSGGPVEIVNPNNTTQVSATGTFTAFDATNTTVPCTGYVPSGGGRSCAWRIYYEDIFAGMAGVGAVAVVLG
jgi:hypothetical protein